MYLLISFHNVVQSFVSFCRLILQMQYIIYIYLYTYMGLHIGLRALTSDVTSDIVLLLFVGLGLLHFFVV